MEEKSRKKIELSFFIVLGIVLLLFLVMLFFGENTARNGDALSGRWKFKHFDKEISTRINAESDVLFLKQFVKSFIVPFTAFLCIIFLPVPISWLSIKCHEFFRM